MGIVTKILNENFLAKSIRKITFTSMQTVESISAVFSQGSQIIYPNTSLESLRNSLTVTATYDDDSTREITGYTLTGSLVEGTSTITVSYEGCTTTFPVTVSHLVVLDSITAVFTQGQTPIYANTPLDSLKENLVVTANYDDGTHSNVIGADYNLVGTLQVGTSTITVTYGGKTTTFEVLVSTGSLTVVSIDAVYTQGNTKVYETTSLNELKENLVVTATYTGGSTAVINDTDYTLSGTLEQGTSTVIVTYEGQTDTFDVIVSGEPSLPVEYQQVDYLENTTYSANNYIDTGVTIVPSTDKVVNTFEITSFPASGKYESPFGDWWAYRTKGIFSFISSNGNGFLRAGGQSDLTSIQLGTLSLNTPYTVSIYRYNATLNGTVVSTGEDYGPSAPSTQLLFNTRNSSGAGVNDIGSFLGKIYSHQIYRNDVLIHDFIPCYRKSDSKVGMYDMVASEFKLANGTIAKGPDSSTKVLESISAVYTQGAQVVYLDTTLDTLKSNLVITATYDDTSTETIAAANYTLSGVLSLGTSTITATYGNKTATFTVNVTEKPTLSSINAVYTQGQTEVYPSTVLDTLKTNLVVTAVYSDSSTSVVGAGSYTLTGTLAEGTSTITVTYQGQTDTFDVTVTGAGGKETETINFCTAANITDTTTIDRIDNFVKTLKTENLWDKMDAIYPFIADTEAGMMLNLKDYTTKALVKQSSGSVSVDPGYSITCSERPLQYPNSLTQSDVTNYGFSTSVMMDQTSISNLVWISTSAGSTGGATTQGDWAIFASSNKIYFRIGAPGGSDTSGSNCDMTQLSSGGYVFTGSVVSGQPVKSYLNGTLGTEPKNIPALTKLYQNSTWYVNGGCVDKYVNPYLLRFCSFGKALTAEEASILDTAIKTLKPNKVSE